ncbi:unnamed protein product [Diatraea saccharalis]|uniref:Uncharacterized protein n=1 Tax=Diatraea saccharalis TaxID=40085 RepID=A0A9N9RAY8_9NEOP|nr:unnamed protein product [Diatraea saccharalis]
MPSGVIFIIYIPSSNYEHILKFGKPRDIISIEDTHVQTKPCRLEVELRNKKSKSIPIHLTQQYYNNEGFNPTLVNINEDDECFTMESILQELLKKLYVEHVVWVSDKTGNYQEVMFPLPTGDQCETMLHCLTQLGIGVRCKSIVRRNREDAKRWRSFVESIRSKLTVKQVVDGVRGGGELSFDYLTLIITAEGNVRSLWMGVLWALTSGTGVALALLQGSAGPLIGIAISASLLPPVVNCGLYWALACIWLLYPDVKIPHLKGESYIGNSSYVPLYHDYLPIEFAVNEVAAPYTSTPDLRRFWEKDIRVAREANRTNLQKENAEERSELVLEDLDQTTDEDLKQKLEAAVQEALDDDTYRKVQRMSYQSHFADEVLRTIGLQPRDPTSARSSVASTPHSYKAPNNNNIADIAAIDKILTSLLGMRESHRSFYSHSGTPRSSRLQFQTGLTHNRRSESWTERIFEDAVVNSVLNNLKANKTNSPDEELFLTPK